MWDFCVTQCFFLTLQYSLDLLFSFSFSVLFSLYACECVCACVCMSGWVYTGNFLAHGRVVVGGLRNMSAGSAVGRDRIDDPAYAASDEAYGTHTHTLSLSLTCTHSYSLSFSLSLYHHHHLHHPYRPFLHHHPTMIQHTTQTG
jgi:hypothetical protein